MVPHRDNHNDDISEEGRVTVLTMEQKILKAIRFDIITIITFIVTIYRIQFF